MAASAVVAKPEPLKITVPKCKVTTEEVEVGESCIPKVRPRGSDMEGEVGERVFGKRARAPKSLRQRREMCSSVVSLNGVLVFPQ